MVRSDVYFDVAMILSKYRRHQIIKLVRYYYISIFASWFFNQTLSIYLHQQDQMFLFSYFLIFPIVLFAYFRIFQSFYFPIFYKDLSHVFLQQFGKEEMFVNIIL